MASKTSFTCFAILLGAVLAVPANAAVTNLVSNGSFESGINPGSFQTLYAPNTSITDWTVSSGNVDYIGTYWQAADGHRSLDMNGYQAGSITASQSITGLTPGAFYTVRFAMAGNPDGGPTVKTMDLMVDGVTKSYSFNTAGHSEANMGWQSEYLIFKAATSSTTLGFASTTLAPSGNETYPQAFGPALDNVSMTAGVPEPATWAMLLLGFFGIGFVGLRRRTHSTLRIA